MAMTTPHIRLGVNLDHVATIRNARGEGHPSLADAVDLALEAGADGITMHLREDRRHILDADLEETAARLADGKVPLNMEMAVTEEMVAIASRLRPPWTCLVPERRAELTTEQGLQVTTALSAACARLAAADIKISLFIDADPAALEMASQLGVNAVEIHTGPWCRAFAADGDGSPREQDEWHKIVAAAEHCAAHDLGFHAGHGLHYDTARKIAGIKGLAEVNIGHFLIGEAIFYGLGEAIRRMRTALDEGAR